MDILRINIYQHFTSQKVDVIEVFRDYTKLAEKIYMADSKNISAK